MTVDIRSALVNAGGVLAYYSLPDLTNSKFLRFVGKTAISTGLLAWYANRDAELMSEGVEVVKEYLDGVDAEELKAAAGITAGVTLGTTILTIAGEKWLYRRAESKRAAGKSLAHTKQGAILAALTAAAVIATDSLDN